MSQQAVLLNISQIGNLMTDQPEKTKDSPAAEKQKWRHIAVSPLDTNGFAQD